MWPLGRGEVNVRFGDFRRVEGILLPFATEYTFGGQALLQQRVVAAGPDAPGLMEESFRRADRLPDCHG